MILVFILLGIIILCSFLFIILILSNLKIKLKNIEINDFKIGKGSIIYIQIYFLDKIKIFPIKFDLSKINKNSIDKMMKKIIQINRNNIIKIDKINKKELLYLLKRLNIVFEKFDLKLNIGLEDALVTSLLVGGISSFISFILPNIVQDYKNQKYIILPTFNKNTINLKLESIINIKIVHIIYIIYIMGKKGRMNYERTSNRRINAAQR